ncbi:MAG: alpha/beta hydrolase family protein [Candidatus Woesearchaeota archaeon]
MTKKKIRKIARDCLGDIPSYDFIPKIKFLSTKKLNYCIVKRFSFENDDCADKQSKKSRSTIVSKIGSTTSSAIDSKVISTVYGYMILPPDFNPNNRYPVIHYIHWHAGQYELGKNELLENHAPNRFLRRMLLDGFILFCIDSYCFGERRNKELFDEELYLAKYNLLYGRTLFGMMLRDELLLLNYIESLRFVNRKKIIATGISMGSTKALWLGSLFDRHHSIIGILCTTKMSELIRVNGLGLHGIYYYPYGLLRYFDTDTLYSCIYPKNLLLINARDDPLSPKKGVDAIVSRLNKIYHNDSKRFKSIIFLDTNHVIKDSMIDDAASWLRDIMALDKIRN